MKKRIIPDGLLRDMPNGIKSLASYTPITFKVIENIIN